MDLDRIVEEIESRLDITTVIGRYVKLKKAGRNHVGLCPFHPEKTPSFTVSPDKGFFYCFGCKAGGNVVHFLSKLEGLTYMEALKILADEVGVQLGQIKINKEKGKEYELLNQVCEYFRKQLKVFKPGQDYLRKRGITDEVSQNFKLGHSPSQGSYLPKFITELGYDLKFAEKLGVLGTSKDGSFYGYMRGRVIFPIHDRMGRVIAFGGRILGEGNPKYLNSQATEVFDKSRTLYGINLAKRSIQQKSRVIVTEGYMDVISMHRVGFTETVSTLGTAFTDDHAKIIRRFTNFVYLFFDSDNAGKTATINAIKSCLKQGLECHVVSSGDVKDPDDLAMKGAEFVESAIKKSTEAMDYILEYFVSLEKDPSTPAAKSRIARQSWEVAGNSLDSIVKKNYLESIAYFLDIPSTAISKYVKKNPRISLDTNSTRSTYERRIVSMMCRDSTIANELIKIVTPEYFKTNTFRNIFEIVKNYEGDIVKLKSAIKAGEIDGKLSSVIAGMMIDDSINGEENLFLKQVLNDITRSSLEMLRKKLDNQDLTSEELGRYLMLQREVRGRKKEKNDNKIEEDRGTGGFEVKERREKNSEKENDFDDEKIEDSLDTSTEEELFIEEEGNEEVCFD
jgi:DNA primase